MRNIILLFFVVLLSCDQEAVVPSYVSIQNINTNFDGQNIDAEAADAYVYLDDEFLGVYPLPTKIAVPKTGEFTLKVETGVLLFLQENFRAKHPFLAAYDTLVNLQAEKEVLLNVHTPLKSSVNFLFSSSFEQDNDEMKILGNSSNNYRSNYEAKLGNYAAVITSSGENDVYLTLKDSLSFDKNEEMFIELHYKNSRRFELGVAYFENNEWVEKSILNQIPLSTNWERVYVNPMPYLQQASAASHFRFYVKAYQHDTEEGKVWIDNLNIIK